MNEVDRLRGRREALEARARIRHAVRTYFETEGFIEVDTPSRVPAPGQEVHLDAFPAGEGRFLITSPEYHMKRVVAGGMGRVVQMSRCYRAEESGPHHLSEFTMIEWYRAHAPLAQIADDCEALVHAAVRAAGASAAPPVDLSGPFERVTVADLFRRHAGMQLAGDESAAELLEKAQQAGHSTGSAQSWDDIFFQVFLDHIEPHLGLVRPTFVFDWPLPLAALARRKADGSNFVERFELYAGGLELANAFGELTDPVEQRARFMAESATRAARGKTVYPLDEKLLAALPNMPPTSGVAVGFDRLCMLALGAHDIRQVVAFADDEV